MYTHVCVQSVHVHVQCMYSYAHEQTYVVILREVLKQCQVFPNREIDI